MLAFYGLELIYEPLPAINGRVIAGATASTPPEADDSPAAENDAMPITPRIQTRVDTSEAESEPPSEAVPVPLSASTPATASAAMTAPADPVCALASASPLTVSPVHIDAESTVAEADPRSPLHARTHPWVPS